MGSSVWIWWVWWVWGPLCTGYGVLSSLCFPNTDWIFRQRLGHCVHLWLFYGATYLWGAFFYVFLLSVFFYVFSFKCWPRSQLTELEESGPIATQWYCKKALKGGPAPPSILHLMAGVKSRDQYICYYCSALQCIDEEKDRNMFYFNVVLIWAKGVKSHKLQVKTYNLNIA